MKVPRLTVFILAALAAGTGARMAFDGLNQRPGTRGKPETAKTKSKGDPAPAKPSVTAPRPGVDEVLAASGGSRLRLLVAWLATATNNELLSMAGNLIPPPLDSGLELRLLMARWAEVNPRAMLKWSQEITTGTPRLKDFGLSDMALVTWAQTDFEAVWAEAQEGHPGYRAAAILGLSSMDPAKCRNLLAADPSLLNCTVNSLNLGYQIIARLVQWNPAEAVTFMEGLPPDQRRPFTETMVSTWAQADPAAAIAWMKTLPAEWQGSMTSFAQWIAEHAPQFIPALLEGQSAGTFRATVLTADLKRLAADDPAGARKRMEELPEGPLRQYGRTLLMQGALKRGDLAEARALADQTGWRIDGTWYPSHEQMITAGGMSSSFSFSGPNAVESLRELFGRIAAVDPAGAADILSTKGSYSQLALGAAETNPGGLAEALSTKPTDEGALRALRAVIDAWADHDPAKASAWVDARAPNSKVREAAMDSLAQSWAASDPAGLLKWAAQREDALNTVWPQLSAQAPDFVLGHLDELFAAQTPKSVESLLSVLSRRPEDLRLVIRQMPESFDAPIGEAVNNWLKENQNEATAWVTELGPGPKRDNAAAALTQWLSSGPRDFEKAFQWAATLPAEKKAGILDEVAGALQSANGDDPEAARKIIRASPLTPEEKQNLLKELDQ